MNFRPCLLALTCLLLAATGLQAQFETASVLGAVRDSSGASVPKATVTLENLQTGNKATAATGVDGEFQFLAVRIGKYKVTAQADGFSVAVSDAFEVTISARQRVDLTLQVGRTTETVTVEGAAKAIETDSSDRGQVVRTQQIELLPLNGRSYADLALLGTGVRKSLIATSRDASFNVNGQRAALNNFMIDGLDNNSYATSNQGFSNQVIQPSPDALEEFKVQTNNYSAEYGRASGAVVNASIRSGTNQFHGAVWEFLRNTQLNAVGFFKPTSGVKPTLVQNQFGFTFGGPIRHDKTFFFVDYEGFRAVSRSVTYSTLPVADQRAGNIGVAVRNPLTGTTYSNGLPASVINPYAAKILADTPLPNMPGLANNYQWMPATQGFNDKGDVKLDHTFNSKWSTFVRVSQRKVNNYEPPSFPGASAKGNNSHVRILNQHLAAAATYTMNPRTLLEFRMGISRSDGGKTPDGVGAPGMLEAYGVSGIPNDPRYYGGLMTINLSGYTGFGRQSSNPQFQNPRVYNPKVNLSRFLGAHTIKAGYEYQRIHTEIDDFNPKYGVEDYGGQFTRPTGASSNSIYNITDFLLGLRDWYELSTPTTANIRQQMHFLYAQDDWKVSPKLTVNFGLRYEFATPQYERDNRLTNFDPASQNVIPAKDGGIYDRALVNPDRNNFAPRFGMAYTITPRTVIRSAYGVSYVHFNRMGAENLLVENYPFFLDVKITQDMTMPVCTSDASPTTCFRPQQMGFPSGLNSTANASLTKQGWIYYLPQNLPTAYIQSWHFTVQRQLTNSLVLDVGYVGSHGLKLVVLGDANQARPNATTENTTLQLRRPYPQLQNIEQSLPAGYSSYHGLQMKLERRFSAGMYLLNSFTWSKAMDNAAGHLEANSGDNSRVNIRDLASERGLSSYNQPLNNTTTALWDVPFGRTRKFGHDIPKLLDGVLGGWRLSAINTMTSGQPFTLRYSPTSQFSVSGLPSYRPNVIGPAVLPDSERTPTNYLSKTNVLVPTDPAKPFGSAGRNTLRGDAFFNLDLGIHKQFGLPGEGRRIEFRAEGFNLFNHTNLVVPNATRSDAAYGTTTTAFPARILQLGLKLYF